MALHAVVPSRLLTHACACAHNERARRRHVRVRGGSGGRWNCRPSARRAVAGGQPYRAALHGSVARPEVRLRCSVALFACPGRMRPASDARRAASVIMSAPAFRSWRHRGVLAANRRAAGTAARSRGPECARPARSVCSAERTGTSVLRAALHFQGQLHVCAPHVPARGQECTRPVRPVCSVARIERLMLRAVLRCQGRLHACAPRVPARVFAGGATWSVRLRCAFQQTCLASSLQLATWRFALFSMAPHLTPSELDFMMAKQEQGKSPTEIHALVSQKRERQGLATPHLPHFREALRGKSYKRSRKETRGRKLKLNSRWVKKLNTKRKALIKAAQGQREVRWEDVRKSARGPKVHRTTLLRSFRREGMSVEARRPRLKPSRTVQQARDRVVYCAEWGTRPPAFFAERIDLIIDNKQFDIPTTQRARKYLASQRVRFHLRTPGEGALPEMTKPGRKKNRLNTGSVAKVCAGVSNGRIVMWEYLPKRWNGDEAAKLYRGAIRKTLRKQRGAKHRYLVFEDNDPTGYKSSKGSAASWRDIALAALAVPWFPAGETASVLGWD